MTTLYRFGSTSTDGAGPSAALVQATDGNFYGTTYQGQLHGAQGGAQGGAQSYGTVFKITPGGTLTTLYNFGCTSTDGTRPYAGLVQATESLAMFPCDRWSSGTA